MIDVLTIIRALSNQKRLDIVRTLRHHMEPVPMQVIRDHIGASKASFSQHIAKLVEAEIVSVTPRGRTSTIMLENNHIAAAIMDAIGE